MIPAPFEYEVAESADHAVALLGQYGEDAKLLAGGHSLLPLMRLRQAAPSVLVDIGRLRDLSYVRDAGDHLAIGALTTHDELHGDELLRSECAILAHTIGGSVAHADPASDLPTVLLALDAELVVHGPSGDRTVPAGSFWKFIFESDLGPQDLLTEIRVPKTGGAGWSYQKFNPRAQDWAVVGVAAVTRNGGTAVALTNMGSTPLRASAVEQALAGTSPPDDALASADYRRHLAKVLVRRAVEEAGSR